MAKIILTGSEKEQNENYDFCFEFLNKNNTFFKVVSQSEKQIEKKRYEVEFTKNIPAKALMQLAELNKKNIKIEL